MLLNIFPVMNIPENNCGFCKGKYCVIEGGGGGGGVVPRKQRRMKFPSIMMMRLSNKAVKSITENKLLGARHRLPNTGLEARQIISLVDHKTGLTLTALGALH